MSKISQDDLIRLLKLIANSICQSKQLRELIAHLQEQERLDSESSFPVVLRFPRFGVVEAKVDLDMPKASTPPQEGTDRGIAEPGEDRVAGEKQGEMATERSPFQKIDGKKLSPNEVAFTDYLVERFDEDSWLHNARIRWP